MSEKKSKASRRHRHQKKKPKTDAAKEIINIDAKLAELVSHKRELLLSIQANKDAIVKATLVVHLEREICELRAENETLLKMGANLKELNLPNLSTPSCEMIQHICEAIFSM
jgi:hypothetical protein